MMDSKILELKQHQKPFLLISVVWLFISLFSVFFSVAPELRFQGFAWCLVFLLLCVLNLIFLSKLVATLVLLMSEEKTESQASTLKFDALIQGMMKFITFGLIAAFLFIAKDAPKISVFMGISTIVVVPLGFGFWLIRAKRG